MRQTKGMIAEQLSSQSFQLMIISQEQTTFTAT